MTETAPVDRDDRLASLPKMPHWDSVIPETKQEKLDLPAYRKEFRAASKSEGPLDLPYFHGGSYYCRGCDTKLVHNTEPCPVCVENEKQMRVEPALRYDAGKTAFSSFATYVDEGFCEEIGKVLAYGAKKYGKHNWQKGMSWSRCFNSARRHLWSWWRGHSIDEESGCHHLALLFCSIMFLFVYERDKIGNDDR